MDDPKLTDLVLRAAYSLDPDAQIKLFKQINDYTLDQQLGYLNVYNYHRVFFRQPWLHNVQDHIHSWTCCWGSQQWRLAWIDDTAPAERRGKLKA